MARSQLKEAGDGLYTDVDIAEGAVVAEYVEDACPSAPSAHNAVCLPATSSAATSPFTHSPTLSPTLNVLLLRAPHDWIIGGG